VPGWSYELHGSALYSLHNSIVWVTRNARVAPECIDDQKLRRKGNVVCTMHSSQRAGDRSRLEGAGRPDAFLRNASGFSLCSTNSDDFRHRLNWFFVVIGELKNFPIVRRDLTVARREWAVIAVPNKRELVSSPSPAPFAANYVVGIDGSIVRREWPRIRKLAKPIQRFRG
jgi:hypothetical protein